MTISSDNELYRLACRARAGDREALSLLVERARLRLFALAWAELRHYEDAQDVVALALTRICLHLEDLRAPERIEFWMRRIVRNEARMLARRRRTRPWEIDPRAGRALQENTEGNRLERQAGLRHDIARALGQIPREQAHALSLYYLIGLSVGEIAHRFDRPEGTIKRWLHQGRSRLAVELKEYAPMETQKETPMEAQLDPQTVPQPETAEGLAPRELTAAILSSHLDAEEVERLKAALQLAGFDQVLILNTLPALTWKGMGGTLEYHLPQPLQMAKLIVMDEWIGGRSSFEMYVLLRATVEGKQAGICQLLSSPTDVTIFASWAAGCDMCFTRETLDMADFARLVAKWLAQTK